MSAPGPGGLSCEQVLERLSDYLDGELGPSERAAVEEHLRGCDACARFGGEVADTLRMLRERLLSDGSAGTLEAIRRRVRSQLPG
jgi:anti-sigma factor RsiW